MSRKPAISVNMPVYNSEHSISEAIESVLNQSFSDFEFIIIDDGSTDGTLDVIHRFNDDRICLIQNDHHYIRTLNKGLSSSSGKYIARMDADDIMHIDRLKVEHALMERCPEMDVCSTWMLRFGEKGEMGPWTTASGWVEYPLLYLLESNFVLNPTVMVRKSFLDKHQLQYKDYFYAEDFKFWCDAAMLDARFYVETQLLHYYRLSEAQVTSLYREDQLYLTVKIRREIINYLAREYGKENAVFYDLYVHTMKLIRTNKISDALFLDFFCRLFKEQFKQPHQT